MPRYVTQQQAADHFQVHVRTIRNWISKGLVTGYRLPGQRAVRVDLDEMLRAMRVIPTTLARPGHKAFGPDARIVKVSTHHPVVVDRTASAEQ